MSAIVNTVFGEEVTEETKHCKDCDQVLPITEFRERGEGSGIKKRRYTICKECEKKKHYVLKRLRRESPPKPEHCECCGKRDDNLHLDHCHDTDEFRGWICESCNTGIGRIGDNLNGVLNVLKYMVHRELSVLNEDDTVSPLYESMILSTDAYIVASKDLLKKIEHG